MSETTTPVPKVVNGSDLLLSVGGNAVGHCTSHTVTMNASTSAVAYKPVASALRSAASLFKSKKVTELAIQIKASGVHFYNEGELSLASAVGAWKEGQSVECECFEREHDATPYISGNFIITSLEHTAGAGDDVTYDIALENDGAPTIDESKIDIQN